MLNLGLPEKQTALVPDPVLGRFLRKLTMPLGDFGITSGTKRGHFLEPRRPKLAETRVLHTTTSTALEERHRSFIPVYNARSSHSGASIAAEVGCEP